MTAALPQLTFYSPTTFEPWDWRNPDTAGIGGSETALIEMAQRLAARGHAVRVYAPIPADTPTPHAGVEWCHIDTADWTRTGVWILSRAPDVADRFPMQRQKQRLWLVCQDEDYQAHWYDRPDRRLKFDRVIALCRAQADQFARRYPGMATRVCVSSNGLRRELVEEVLAENLPREPYRIVYASSPDRGLEPVLAIHARLRQMIPELELHVCYGFDNLDKAIAEVEKFGLDKVTGKARRWYYSVKDLKTKLDAPGIVHHGRLPQRALYREIARSSLWLYPVNFRESNCISSMEAQALGAVPIVSPVWAVGENVQHGVHIEGDPFLDLLTQARFVGYAHQLLLEPERQEAIRQEMMPWALTHFDYERWVDQWQGWMREECNSAV